MSSNMWDQDAMLAADEKYRAEKAETPGLDREAVRKMLAAFVEPFGRGGYEAISWRRIEDILDAILAATAVSQPPINDREAVAHFRKECEQVHRRLTDDEVWLLESFAYGRSSVSQPPTSRQSAGEVEALIRDTTEYINDCQDDDGLVHVSRGYLYSVKEALLLPAQPGPALVVEPDA